MANEQTERTAFQSPLRFLARRYGALSKMEMIDFKYIGHEINIKNIRNFILDTGLGETDTLLLNPTDFDSVVLEYRDQFSDSLFNPFIYLSVLIKEDKNNAVPLNRVGIYRNDTDSIRLIPEDQFYDGQPAYRCGWCGNIVDEEGSELFGAERTKFIKYIESSSSVIVKKVNGKCCPNGAN